MSAHVYWFFGRGDWLAPQRLGSTISSALIFAHLFAIAVIIARDIVEKPLSMRLIIGIVGGTFFGTLTWFAHVFLFLYQSKPNMLTLILGGLALVIGFVVVGLPIGKSKVRTIISMFISAIAIYGTIFITYNNYLVDSSAQALLYFQLDNPNDIYLIGLPN
ncbi:MAG: hypothetical protein AAFV93_22400 [Chloroflexota bacterium]